MLSHEKSDTAIEPLSRIVTRPEKKSICAVPRAFKPENTVTTARAQATVSGSAADECQKSSRQANMFNETSIHTAQLLINRSVRALEGSDSNKIQQSASRKVRALLTMVDEARSAAAREED